MAFKKGHIPWNIGLKDWMPKESKKSMAEKNKGKIPWNKNLTKEADERIKPNSRSIKKGEHLSPQTEFKKGNIPWIKGKHISPETEFKKRKNPNLNLEKRLCLVCGLEYLPNSHTQKYCCECSKQKDKNRKDKWKEKNTDYEKEYYQKNKEKINKQSKEYRQKNKKTILKQKKENYRKNKGKILKKQKESRQRPEVKIREIKYYQRFVEEENKRRKKLRLPLVGEGWKSEMELLFYVYNLFQNYEILTHHRRTLGDWGLQGLELDIYIPKLKLAFEYMGKQHYDEHSFYNLTKFNTRKEDFEYQQYKDRCKKRICKLKGITLIRIKHNEKLSEQLILSKLKYIPSLLNIQKKLTTKEIK